MPPNTHPTIEEVSAGLKKLVRHGLPASADKVDEDLTNLLGVIARSIHPEETLSRVDAFNQLAMGILDNNEDSIRGPAARTLFATEPGTKGPNLTARRVIGAGIYHCAPEHFRKRIEPTLVRDLAEALYRDSLRYKSRARRAPATLEATGDSPTLHDEDLTAQEEHLSRIWQHVYGLRAELIAVGRRQDNPELAAETEEHRQAVGIQYRQLRHLVDQYLETYGERIIKQGDNEYDAEGIIRLSGWRL